MYIDTISVQWKGYDNSFNSWIDKKDSIKTSQYFCKTYESYSRNVKSELGLFSYATTSDLKGATGADLSD